MNMYRVSTDLREEEYIGNGSTVVLEVKQQCGSLYYFRTIEAAAKAAIELGTGIDVMPYTQGTRFMDEWF